MKHRLENTVGGLSLAALISGCTAAAPEPQPTSVATKQSIVEIQPTPTATSTPPSEPGKKLVFPTPEPKSLSEFASLNFELMSPTAKSIKGLSYKEFMRQKGYEVFIGQLIPRQAGTVVKEEGLPTKILPDTGAQDLPEEYSLKAGSELTSIGYVILAVKVGPAKKGELKRQSWIARPIKVVLGEGNPPVDMWVYNQLQFKDENTITTFIQLINPRPTTNI